MIPQQLNQITKAHIDALVVQETSERRTLDYKEFLPSNSDDDKREFSYDVSSFANASGGDLIFGIADQRGGDGKSTGIPNYANGLAGNVDVLRLENILQSTITPRIPAVKFHQIPGFAQGPVLIVRIPKSWAAPHMATYKGLTRFYSRNSAGKYPLDVFEIRSAFALSEDLPKRLRSFRQERLASIVAGETPTDPDKPKVILHVVPLGSLDLAATLDLSGAERFTMPLQPIRATGWNHRFNFDGFLTYSPHALNNYVQLFRSGAIEAVDCTLLDYPKVSKTPFIPLSAFERILIDSAVRYMGLQKQLGFTPPFFIMVSLIGVRGYWAMSDSYLTPSGSAIDRDTVIPNDVVVEEFQAEPSRILKPIFDTIAQAAGLPGSPNYDRHGDYISVRH